eukprot:2838634-Amphidinium_carterae.3
MFIGCKTKTWALYLAISGRFQRAMLLDPELAKSYEGLTLRAMGKDSKAAKEAFKIKWAATHCWTPRPQTSLRGAAAQAIN